MNLSISFCFEHVSENSAYAVGHLHQSVLGPEKYKILQKKKKELRKKTIIIIVIVDSLRRFKVTNVFFFLHDSDK